MSLLTNDAVVATTNHGISRRRILHGVAWAAPAVIVATAAPAAAASATTPLGASLPSGTGASFTDGQVASAYQASYWNATSGSSLKVVNSQVYIQNAGNGVPAMTGITATLVIPSNATGTVSWGMGNVSGIPSGTPWTLASASRSGGFVTLVLVYTGAPLGPWSGVWLGNVWVGSATDPRPGSSTMTVNATHQGGGTSMVTAGAAVS